MYSRDDTIHIKPNMWQKLPQILLLKSFKILLLFLQECVECLSSLLTNKDDHHVGDGALKCFASLADRFIRKNVDPLPLASNGLTQELLNRLAHAGQVTSTSSAAEVSFSND